jgi:hypothetical protein
LEKVEKGVEQMKHHMNKDTRTWIILATLIVVFILTTLWVTSTFWLSRLPWEPHPRPPEYVSGDIELFYTIETVVSMMNVTLSIFLLFTYISIYRKTRSEFTVGLIIFSAVLLLHAFTSIPLVRLIFGFGGFGLGPFAMLPGIFTFVALAILVYLSAKY